MELKKVTLNHVHEQLGAKMVPFAGYNMPVRYTSDMHEHHAVRQNVGVFDVSHMGEFMVRGPKALGLIQQVASNDASKLAAGQAQYAYLSNETGGIVDDLLVYKLAEGEYMLVVNASNIEKDWNWINKFNTEGAMLENISDRTSLFAVQGPKAAEALQSLTSIDLKSMKYYTFEKRDFAGAKDVIISATGYTGAGGFELYVDNKDAEKVWKAIMEAGASLGIQPIGLGARDTLRLEMGYCLYGNDIDENTCPLEAGLGWVSKFNKSFTNSDNLLKRKEEGLDKKLVGFVMVDKGIPRSHYKIFDESEAQIGEVTSGSQSPSLGKGIGLGYVKIGFSKPGTTIYIGIRNKMLKAEIARLPLFSKA